MLQSLRYALRQLRNSPGFAATAILTLALGIGATTAIFSILDAVLLRPLPFPHPDRLVAIVSVPDETVAIPTAQDWQTRGNSFQSIAAYRGWAPTVRTAQGVEVGNIVEVSQNFFSTLGASFALGGDFPQTGKERDCTSQAIVSGAFWKRLGGGSSLGARTLEINRRTFQITGVLPLSQTIEGNGSLNQPEIFVPTGCDPWQRPTARGDIGYWIIGRLRSGVSIPQATADLARVQATLQHDFPNDYNGIAGRPPVILPWITRLTGTDTRPALFSTLAACTLLLIIACANLANLLLARSIRRRREFATRATLGASLRQLLVQLLMESAVLAVAGAAAGIAIAYGVLRLLLQARALRMPRLAHASISPGVLAFVVLVTAMVTILLTLLPAWRTLRPDLVRDLAASGRASGGSSLRRAGRILVAAQIAFTLVLVACAAWTVSSVYALLHQPLGFAPDHLLMAGVDIDSTSVTPRYDAARTNLYFTQLVAILRRLPGVEAVAATNHPPLGEAVDRYGFCSDTHPDQCGTHVAINPDFYHVTPGYFSAIGQPLLAGRDFTSADNSQPHVAIVNRALAEREWPGQSALGHRIFAGDIQDWATVIGVVSNVHSYNLESAPGPDLYLPEADQPKTAMVAILRTAGDPALLTKSVRDIIRAQHADLSLYHLRTMEQEMAYEVDLRSFLMEIAAAFGTLALFLAILGTYGLLAYEVSLREKEIGIRLALGSSREAIVQLLLGQESRWILIGAAAGLCGAMLTGYALRAQFYHARAASLPVLAASLALLILPSLVAIALPARRAAQLDPVQTLRSE
ncbi:MAG TPA: ABC transporter permease [Acidobacteriaceae bacterium]